jgi:outer membrane protein OmpA-like peptidoglycan-associated protein
MILTQVYHRLSILLLPAFLIFFSFSLVAQTDTLSVFFDLDEDTDFNANVLDENSNVLPLMDGIMIIGYADHLGSASYNVAISMRRAESVARYLMSQGVSKRKIYLVKGGGELPDDRPDPRGNLAHRRVDVIIPFSEKPSRRDDREALPPTPTPPKPLPTPEVFEIDSVKRTNLVLEGLSFIPGRHYPTPESMPVLERLVETMKKYPKLKIEIQGHICCEYEEYDGLDIDTKELKLSENRAKYVYKYLIQNGIYESRMSYAGKGSSDPKVYPERSEEDMQMNRRVELKIVEF